MGFVNFKSVCGGAGLILSVCLSLTAHASWLSQVAPSLKEHCGAIVTINMDSVPAHLETGERESQQMKLKRLELDFIFNKLMADNLPSGVAFAESRKDEALCRTTNVRIGCDTIQLLEKYGILSLLEEKGYSKHQYTPYWDDEKDGNGTLVFCKEDTQLGGTIQLHKNYSSWGKESSDDRSMPVLINNNNAFGVIHKSPGYGGKVESNMEAIVNNMMDQFFAENTSKFALLSGDFNLFPDTQDQNKQFEKLLNDRQLFLSKDKQGMIIFSGGEDNSDKKVFVGDVDFSFVTGVNDVSMFAKAALSDKSLEDLDSLAEALLAIYKQADDYLEKNNALDEIYANKISNCQDENKKIVKIVDFITEQENGLLSLDDKKLSLLMYWLQSRLVAAAHLAESNGNASEKFDTSKPVEVLTGFLKKNNISMPVASGMLDRFVTRQCEEDRVRQLAIVALPHTDSLSAEALSEGLDETARADGKQIGREGFSHTIKNIRATGAVSNSSDHLTTIYYIVNKEKKE